MYILQFDGMLRLETKKKVQTDFLGYGWHVIKNDIEVARGFGLYVHKNMINSNIAEYVALIEGLKALTDLRVWNDPIEIRGDAKCVINQMKGLAAVHSIPTRKFHRRARRLSANFYFLTWKWVPRKENKRADNLSRRGLRQLYALPDAYENAMNQLRTSAAAGRRYIPLFDLCVFTLH